MPGAQGNDRRSGIDLLCGGFPCQDLSVAGKRAGLGGSRSGLFFEIVRIAKILRPPWGLFENVPGLLSSGGGADMLTVLQGLRECWPAVGYRVLDSQHFGVAQRRRRVFFVCGPSEAGVKAVLFEPEGGGGDSQEGGEAGEGATNAITQGTGRVGSRGADDGANIVTHSLTGEGHDAGEDGTGRGTPIVATLNSGGNDGGFQTEPGEHLLAYGWNKSSSQSMSAGPLTPALSSSPQSNPAVGVRRLTPLECERLQGFPDGWTCLCQPMEAYRDDPDGAAMCCKCPDSPRYRALGNAVTVNVIEWIGKRL
jgi:DNA (cytosine-5)-methyltransferase 1